MTAIELSSWTLLPLLAASGLSVEDRAIVPLLQRAAPGLKHVIILNRLPVSEQLNLVLALGQSWKGNDVPSEAFLWTNNTRLRRLSHTSAADRCRSSFRSAKQFRLATEKNQDGLESPLVVQKVGPKEKQYRLPQSELAS